MLANGVFAGAEIAVIALRRSRVRELVAAGRGSARAVEALRADPERFLATVQIGITVVSATAAAFGGASIARRLEAVLLRVPALAPEAEALSVAAVVALVSYLSLVLGELVPKSLALRAAERYALLVARPFGLLAAAARPLVWLLTASSNAVLRLFGDRTSFTEARMSGEELRQLVQESAKSGAIHPEAGEIATRALDFGGLVAADVMVPRRDVRALPRTATQDEIRALLMEEGHNRMPVYDGTVDNVVGYIAVKDVLALAWGGGLVVLQDLLRPAWFVPESKRAVELLHEMRERRVPLAMVVDEAGGLSGIVTLEDLLEELVGEMLTERDRPQRGPEARREPDGSVRAPGAAPVRDLNREFGLSLPEGADWTTVAGLCIAQAGAIPAVGERIPVADGYVVEIVDASPRRIREVRIRPGAPPRR